MDLHSLAIIEAWHNPRFQAELEQDPREALAKLAARCGLSPEVAGPLIAAADVPFTIPPNPVGASPAERRRILARKESTTARQPTSRIRLSPEQQEAIRLATGKVIVWLELTPEALGEGPVDPGAVRAGMGLPTTWDC
jgi:hypothetical protein